MFVGASGYGDVPVNRQIRITAVRTGFFGQKYVLDRIAVPFDRSRLGVGAEVLFGIHDGCFIQYCVSVFFRSSHVV